MAESPPPADAPESLTDSDVRLLRDLDNIFTDEARELRKSRRLRRGIVAVAVVLLVVAFWMQEGSGWTPFLTLLLATLAGGFIGLTAFLEQSAKHWPLLRRLVDHQRVRELLTQQEPPSQPPSSRRSPNE